jgi:hypothetical protein
MKSNFAAPAARLCRWSVAFIWVYQGLVPKLIFHAPDELAMNMAAGFGATGARHFSTSAGVAEIVLGVLVLVTRARWTLHLTICLMIALTTLVAVVRPVYLLGAFNALTLNVATAALALCSLLLEKNSQ